MRSLPRLIPPVACLLGLAAPVTAQNLYDLRLADIEFVDGPVNAFSVSTRLIGRANVTFTNLGSVSSGHDATDLISEVTRTYDDGRVSLDTRTDTDGNDLLDDGRTNSWYYYSASQVTPDQSGIAFHQYSSVSEGQNRSVESGLMPGLDVEYSLRLGLFARPAPDRPARISWGWAIGIGFSDVNVKTSGTLFATLHKLTDTYSLLGAAVPDVGDGDDDSDDDIDDPDGPGYTSPSQRVESVTNADGTVTEYVVDTTTLLANRPESRLEEIFEGGAEIEGFWQVRGASMTVRTGPWIRWQPAEKFSLRLSAGGAVTLLGLRMRYDERLVAANGLQLSDTTDVLIQEQDETESQSFAVGGLFSGLDAEWWFTRRTGFFGSAYYEQFSQEGTLNAGERGARIEISSGVGVRFGITTRF